MTDKEELESEIYRLENKREDLEDKMRQVERMREEEEYNLRCAYRKLEESWDKYGNKNSEFAALLEEEKAYLDTFRARFSEQDTEISREFEREMNSIDGKVYELKTQLREEESEEGDD